MDKHPKRRKSKDNPYKIIIENNKYLITFKNSNNAVEKIEIKKEIYEAFDRFELDDISQMHKDDNHKDLNVYDYTEESDNFIYANSIYETKSIEQIVEEKIRNEELYEIIKTLSLTQQRRIKLYYFENLKLDEIAKREKTSHQAISKSINVALQEIKKKLKN